MPTLFEEFDGLPDWIDPDLVEGAAVWRRWAYALGALGNAARLTPTLRAGWLSCCRCPAGTSARGRCTGTSRPHDGGSKYAGRAILTPGSLGRNISLHVRIMHVSVRARVQQHPEWDSARWGLPISQSAMLLTFAGRQRCTGVGSLPARPHHFPA